MQDGNHQTRQKHDRHRVPPHAFANALWYVEVGYVSNSQTVIPDDIFLRTNNNEGFCRATAMRLTSDIL